MRYTSEVSLDEGEGVDDLCMMLMIGRRQ